MKNIVLCFVMTLFFVNTMVVSAWSAPCLQSAGIEISQEIPMNMNGDTPCHDEQQAAQDHCEGLCFCLHATLHQTPVFQTSVITPPQLIKERIAAIDDHATSITPSPALRPPIKNS